MTGYPRLSIQEFGSSLLDSGDLDPVYVALHRCGWSRPHQCRWLVAYWCFYNCGVASWLSEREGPEFWAVMMKAARNDELSPPGERWPRGRERRHFRGAAGISAVAQLAQAYSEHPERMVDLICEYAPDFKDVTGKVMEHPLFGPWIAFKVADMIERVLGVHVDFTEAAVFMFKDPVKAAVMYWNQQNYHELEDQPGPPFIRNVIIPEVVSELTCYFAHVKAPPRNDRPVGLQEVETVLCKWKSHMHGHYPPGLDTREIRESLTLWAPHSWAASNFLRAMP